MSDWQKIAEFARKKVATLSKEHATRLEFEIKEIDKQGANDYWINLLKSKQKFDANTNGLVLPFLLGITPVDPIKAGIPHRVEYHADLPDIDCDLQPAARPLIRQYATKKYGAENVCSVGLWQTYNPKLALQDAARALGADYHDILNITKDFPEDFDEMSKEDALKGFDELAAYYKLNPNVVDMAYRIVGRIKTQGRHAGGLIISSVPIREYVPLMKLGEDKEWTTSWTEGKNTQLSKFGFVKFDMLGLKTIQYIANATKLIKQNRSVDIDWEKVPLDDKDTLALAASLKTDSTFQFDTDLAKSIILRGGVKSFNDLMVYTSLGRPGPLPLVDEYVKRRDDPRQAWRVQTHPKLVELLDSTFGVICYQEQLQQVWVDVCGFTYAEAEEARKIIAKKWQDKLPALGQKVVKGAVRLLGGKKAEELWQSMVTFGRYAFNMAHATAYTIIAYRTLWLKTHYAPEWWAAVMSDCNRERLVRYIGIAKSEGVQMGAIDCRTLTESFTVSGERVLPGLNLVKGIGTSSKRLAENNADYKSVDEFIEKNGKGRIVMERLIKLGGFDKIFRNRKTLWYWYLWKHAGEKKTKDLVKAAFAWPENRIVAERQKQIMAFRKLYPKKKVPPKLENWNPKIDPTFDDFAKKFNEDFMDREILEFEKAHLGFYWSSPMSQFVHKNLTIAQAKFSGKLECVIESVTLKKSEKTGNEYMKLTVTDGLETAPLVVWSDALLDKTNTEALSVGGGISVQATWSDKYRSFSIASGSMVIPLVKKGLEPDAPVLPAPDELEAAYAADE